MQFSQQLEEQLPRSLRAAISRPVWVPSALVALGLIAGILSAFVDPPVMVRVVLGLPLILLLVRYPYGLLLLWALLGMFIGSNLALFNGKNLDTGLVIPTLLVMGTMPLRQIFQRMPALAAYCAYLVWVLLGIQRSPLGTINFLKIWTLQLAGIALAAIAMRVLTSRRRLLGLVDAILVAGTAIALYGIYGYLTQSNGVVDPATGGFRSTSVFSDAPPLALLLSLILPLAIYRAYVAHVAHAAVEQVSAILAALTLLGAVALTFTRGAMLSIPLSVLLLFIVVPTRRLRIVLLGGVTSVVAAALVLATVVRMPLLARFFNGDVGTLNGRTDLWQALLQNFDPLRIFGSGMGAADALLAQLPVGAGGQPGRGTIATSASDLFVGTLFDAGMVGLALLAGTFVLLGWGLLAGIRHTHGERRVLFVVAAMALTNALAQSIEVSDLWDQSIGVIFWIIMALPFAACWLNRPLLAGPKPVVVTPRRRELMTRQTNVADGPEAIPQTRPPRGDALGPTWRQAASPPREVSKEEGAASVEKPLRICLLGLHFSPIAGGAEQRAERQARQLQALGYQVMIVTLRHHRTWPRREILGNLGNLVVIRVGGVYRRTGVLRIGRLAIWPAMLLVACALWRLRSQYNVIHTMQISPLAAVAALIGGIARKPVILSLQSVGSGTELASGRNGAQSEHAGWSNDRRVRRSREDERSGFAGLRQSVLGGPLLVRYLQHAQVTYQALSRRGATYLATEGIPAERISHISGSVDTVVFHPAPSPSGSGPAYTREIVCVARLEFAKGVDVLLRAWARLTRSDTTLEITSDVSPHARLLLVGDGMLQPQLEALARQLTIQETVIFVGRRDDIPQVLQQCYGFVLPSRWEGMSNALLEAMACGLPCVATRVSGSEDVLEDSVNGLLVPPEQPGALCAALQRLLSNPEEAACLGRTARATVEQNYSLSAVIKQHIALYRRLTGGARRLEGLTPVRMGSQ